MHAEGDGSGLGRVSNLSIAESLRRASGYFRMNSSRSASARLWLSYSYKSNVAFPLLNVSLTRGLSRKSADCVLSLNRVCTSNWELRRIDDGAPGPPSQLSPNRPLRSRLKVDGRLNGPTFKSESNTMGITTIGVGLGVTPCVIKTWCSHYLNRKTRRQKRGCAYLNKTLSERLTVLLQLPRILLTMLAST